MKAAAAAAVLPQSVPLSRRLADYVTLTKPRISVMVLVTVAAGAILASGPVVDLLLLAHTLFGTALVAAGASALNHLIERHTDARMKRTANRPLPAGRLQPVEVMVFGVALGLVGVGYLAVSLRQPWAPLAAAITFVLYVGVYTPLKSRSPLNTLIGAVPGALPPVIGWLAVRGELGFGATLLFALLFFWQVPHFLAIAWIYREDYARAGLKMLPVVDPHGVMTGRNMVLYTLALVPVSLAPVFLAGAGPIYASGAVLLGVLFLFYTVGFAYAPGVPQARRALRASLLYLPGLLALLIANHLT